MVPERMLLHVRSLACGDSTAVRLKFKRRLIEQAHGRWPGRQSHFVGINAQARRSSKPSAGWWDKLPQPSCEPSTIYNNHHHQINLRVPIP